MVSVQPSHSSKIVWIPPICGLVASVLAGLVLRYTGYEYRHEISMATYFVVSILVGGYYNGRLKSRPASVIGLAVLFGAVGATLMHW